MLRRTMMRNDENDNLTYTGTHPQDTRKGYPYHTREQARPCMVGIPLAGILGRGILVVSRGILLIVLLTTLLFLFPLTASAHTLANGAGTGRIYGQLLDGTKKN